MKNKSSLLGNTLAGILVGSALFTAACVPGDGEKEVPEHIAKALPLAESVQIRVPNAAARFDTGATQNESDVFHVAMLGELAQYYVVTRSVSLGLNAGASWTLFLVHAIVSTPPTSVDGNLYTWGPGSGALDPADWRLEVRENTDGSYDWSLDGRKKNGGDGEFHPVIFGHSNTGDSRTGRGSYTLDFDAAELVNPLENDEVGLVSVQYDLRDPDDGIPTLIMDIDTREPDSNGVMQDVHFEYRYDEASDGSGNLLFRLHSDLDEDGSLLEDAIIKAQWQADGQGRADVRATGGDLAELTVEVSECWDENFGRTFYVDSQNWAPMEGVEDTCVFEKADTQ